MRKRLLLVIVVLIIIITFYSGCISEDNKDNDNLDYKDIRNRLQSVLSDGWAITEYEEDTLPYNYEGDSNCLFIKIENNGTIENKTLKAIEPDNPHPFYYLWFTPLDWDGTPKQSSVQNWWPSWPDGNITKECKIYYATDGDSSNLIDKIFDEFNR